MRKAYEYLDEIESVKFNQSDDIFHRNSVIEELIKRIQIDVIEETVKLCAKNAALNYADGRVCLPDYAEEPFNAVCDDLDNCHYISRNSILNCAEILKKEL